MASREIDTLFASALGQHQAGHLGAAENGYRRVLAIVPEHVNALHCLGVLNHQRGRSRDAVKLIGRAIARDSRVPEFSLQSRRRT